MNFKTKEELISDVNYQGISPEYRNGQRSGISIAFESFAERITFFKRYRGDPEYKFKKEQPKAYKLYSKWREREWKVRRYTFWSSVDKYDYDDWLFNYCFGNVIG